MERRYQKLAKLEDVQKLPNGITVANVPHTPKGGARSTQDSRSDLNEPSIDNAMTIKQKNEINFNVRPNEEENNQSQTEESYEDKEKQQSFVIKVPARQRKPIEVKIQIDGGSKKDRIKLRNSCVENGSAEAVTVLSNGHSTFTRAERQFENSPPAKVTNTQAQNQRLQQNSDQTDFRVGPQKKVVRPSTAKPKQTSTVRQHKNSLETNMEATNTIFDISNRPSVRKNTKINRPGSSMPKKNTGLGQNIRLQGKIRPSSAKKQAFQANGV